MLPVVAFKKIFSAFTARERIVAAAAALLVLTSGIALGVVAIRDATRAVPARGGDYVEGFVGQPVYVNPVLAASEVDKSLVRLVFSPLGDLAEKITPGEDARSWKVRLKEDRRWQDGAKITSDDIVFTVQRIQDSESRSPLAGLWQGVATQRISELELQFSLVNPYAFFPDVMERLYPIPKHIFNEVPPANWRLSDYNLKPVGSGSFAFDGYKKRPDGFITAYTVKPWRDASEAAFIGAISFQLYTRKTDLIEAFNRGGIDGAASLEPEDLARIQRPHELVSFHLPNYYAVFLNQGKSVPLKDPLVRKALSIALDRQAITEAALGSLGSPAYGPLPQSSPLAPPEDTARASSSPLTATDLLEQGQWKRNASGTREKIINKSVVPLTLTLAVPDIDFLAKTAQLLKHSWEELGITVAVNILQGDDMRTAVKNRDYEMLLFGTMLGQSYDLYLFWHSSQRFYPGLNLGIYNSKKTDNLIEAIRQEPDPARRAAEFLDLQKIITADYPAIFLYSADRAFVFEKSLRGVEGGSIAEATDRFSRATAWYLRTARVLK